MSIIYTSQTRLNFDIDELLRMGISRAYVSPYTTNNQGLPEPDVIHSNLEELAGKAEEAKKKGLEVFPFFVTINHPEGNYELPPRYRRQRNPDGSERSAFICFRDKTRQEEIINFAKKAAQLGFERILFDDDLRDAFCYCDEHLNGFKGFQGKSRNEISTILNNTLTTPEYERLRIEWYNYKNNGMEEYANKLRQGIHSINPECRIGICNSAKRCHDFSGRNPKRWLQLFSSDTAPAFVRLCGECYDDDLMHLAQSTGWHIYFHNTYPAETEQMLEICSSSLIGYRSPGTVLLETKAAIAATGVKTVHWATTEDFRPTQLQDFIGPAKKTFTEIAGKIPTPPAAHLQLYIDYQLGPYTPVNISAAYGSLYDPMIAYNITALVGLPIVPKPYISENQPAIICSAYISREMVKNIDSYINNGGVAILDATAAKCYKTYGGEAEFNIQGPVSRHSYEISPSGRKDDLAGSLTPETVYLIDTTSASALWSGYDLLNNITGSTTAIIPVSKGKLVILGYDLAVTGSKLIRQEWRERILEIADITGIVFPAYWQGSVAVQCLYYGNRICLINYNTNDVTGEIITNGKRNVQPVKMRPFDLKFVRTCK